MRFGFEIKSSAPKYWMLNAVRAYFVELLSGREEVKLDIQIGNALCQKIREILGRLVPRRDQGTRHEEDLNFFIE